MGTLYIVATPIGNLEDITFRAVKVFKLADYILCEDTRVTAKLLNRYGIDKKMLSLNDFNEKSRIDQILADLLSGLNIALVSDAGTPLISDPGFKLVRESIANNIRVESIPGPSSVVASLVVSGLPPDKFLFLGFLPKQETKVKKNLQNLKDIRRIIQLTFIIYESPYRLLRTLRSIEDIFGNVNVTVCRELTKLHEEVQRGVISEIISRFERGTLKGEFVILF